MTESQKREGSSGKELWREVYAEELSREPHKIQIDGKYREGDTITLEMFRIPGIEWALFWDNTVELWVVVNLVTSQQWGLFDTFDMAKCYALNIACMTISDNPEDPFPIPHEHVHILSLVEQFGMKRYVSQDPQDRIQFS